MRSLAPTLASLAVLTPAAMAGAQALEDQRGDQVRASIASESSPAERAENIDALPGTFRVASAGPLSTGLAFSATVGYGYTEDVLQLADSHHRMRGAVAATFRPSSWLAAGLRFDGRYDRHRGEMIENDDGYIGDARVNVLATTEVAEGIGIGGQLVGWLPGGFGGLSLDAKLIVSLATGPVIVSVNGGFRLDRSADSVDDADALSASDRLALGVSDSNAVLLGLSLAAEFGQIEVIGEGSWDLLIGENAPPAAESPLRIGVGFRLAVSDKHRVAAMVEGSLGRAPFVSNSQPLVPVEPLLGVSITLSQRPGSTPRFSPAVAGETAIGSGEDVIVDPRAAVAGLTGTIRDEDGAPIAGAVVRVAGRDVLTGDAGGWSAEQIEPGQITVAVSATGYASATESVRLGDDEVRNITIILKKLETGVLRGVVVSFGGAPVAAAIKITPGDYSVSADADGTFEVLLPPGTYTATASAPGFSQRSVNATIKVPGPIVIVNIELPNGKPPKGAP